MANIFLAVVIGVAVAVPIGLEYYMAVALAWRMGYGFNQEIQSE